MRTTPSFIRLLLVIAVAALTTTVFVAPARADVTLVDKTVFEGIGTSHWFASAGETTTVVSGDKLRQESNLKATGAFMKHFNKEGTRTATIMRVDRKMMYLIDYKNEAYQEFPFSNYKAMQEEMTKSMEQAKAQQAQENPEGEEAKPAFECDPVKLKADRTGEKGTFGGFEAAKTVISGDQTCRDTESKATCRIVYTYELWTTPPTGAFEELMSFYKKQAQAMGMSMDDNQMKAIAGAAQALASANTEGLEAVMKEMSKVEGYPIKTHIQIETGGDCMATGQGSEEGASENPMKEMGKSFKGLFKRKNKGGEEEAKEEKDSGSSTPGLTKVFGMGSELVSVSKTGAPADAFEPPAGFKKTEFEMPSTK